MTFKTFDRVRLSEHGKRICPNSDDGRIGTVDGTGATANQIRVIWDDLKTPIVFHKSYLELVPK